MIDAGDFGAWLRTLLAARAEGGEMDVPCGTCTACCTSGMFVHVEPDEVEALRAIPKALRFPAPGRRPGHVVLPYDEHGRCPMLVDGACSIYEVRPRTCRRFDCRVYRAAGVEPEQRRIAERVRAWAFSYASDDDRAAHEAVRAAAVRIRARSDAPAAPGDLALQAVDER